MMLILKLFLDLLATVGLIGMVWWMPDPSIPFTLSFLIFIHGLKSMTWDIDQEVKKMKRP